MSANLKYIGQIQTPYKTLADCPNNIRIDGPLCQLNLCSEYQSELRGLQQGQHILILYWLGDSAQRATAQTNKADKEGPGTFALRTPFRPNPIGAAVLPIEAICLDQISVRGLDCLDKTQLLDIKPAIYTEVPGTA